MTMPPTLPQVDFRNAYYIKLGAGGKWERHAIGHGLLRLGWLGTPITEINSHQWDVIGKRLLDDSRNIATVATTDLNRLRDIVYSTPEDIWITFSGGKLWWARVAADSVEEDSISRFRRLSQDWSDRALNGRLLLATELPGALAQVQAFRGTVCNVRERKLLQRVLEGRQSEHAVAIARHSAALADAIEQAIKQLHWKDYEILVDMVFRASGWRRTSVMGQQAKSYDLELVEPLTQDKVVVQIKSKANMRDLQAVIDDLGNGGYKRIFFAVHSPSQDLIAAEGLPDIVEVVPPGRLAELAVDAGLARWIQEKMV